MNFKPFEYVLTRNYMYLNSNFHHILTVNFKVNLQIISSSALLSIIKKNLINLEVKLLPETSIILIYYIFHILQFIYSLKINK